jgi:hypothetical protein
MACAAGRICVAGTCQTAAVSCRAWRAANPTLTSGVYLLDTDGAGPLTPYNAYCDMSTAGGGWTLAAVFSNRDGLVWQPTGTAWTSTSTFGDATTVLGTADAKSRAFNEVPGTEVLVLRQGGLIEVQSVSTCFASQTLLSLMSRNSTTATSCAVSCSTVAVGGSWTGQAFQDSRLRFRCCDDDGGCVARDPGGFTIDTDDNSFITTMNNANNDYNFGLGAGYTGSYADFDSSTDDNGTATDLTPRYLWIR